MKTALQTSNGHLHSATTSSWNQLSVVIITLNEGNNLARCLGQFPRNCELVVVDSGSVDSTVEIAKSHGAIVFSRPFTNYADQKNYAISKATRTWVLSLDADEELTPKFIKSLLVAIDDREGYAGYRIARRLVFMGRKLRFGRAIDYPMRLFRNGCANFDGSVHEALVLSNGIIAPKPINGWVLHHSYRDLNDYFVRFNQYTMQVAIKHRITKPNFKPNILAHCFRQPIEFLSRFIVRGGFLDGYPGFAYAMLSSMYAFVKYAKLIELQSKDANRSS